MENFLCMFAFFRAQDSESWHDGPYAETDIDFFMLRRH